MGAESSILGLVDIVGGVAIAAAVREIADSSSGFPFGLQVGHGSQLPPACVTCSRTLLGVWQLWPVKETALSPESTA